MSGTASGARGRMTVSGGHFFVIPTFFKDPDMFWWPKFTHHTFSLHPYTLNIKAWDDGRSPDFFFFLSKLFRLRVANNTPTRETSTAAILRDNIKRG